MINSIVEKREETALTLSKSFENFWSDIGKFSARDVGEVEKFFRKEHRSSGMFPIYLTDNSRTHISFISYWINKHGSTVAIRLTTRDKSGTVVEKSWIPVTELKAFEGIDS